MVDGVTAIIGAAGLGLANTISKGNEQIQMPTASLAQGRNLVYGIRYRIFASRGQLALLCLGQENMSAVPGGDGGTGRLVWIEGRGRACEQVATRSLFISRVICEEVLEQPRRRFA